MTRVAQIVAIERDDARGARFSYVGNCQDVTRIDCRAVHLLAGMSAACAPVRF